MAIDKIGSKALTDCSVVAADIAPGTITGTQLAGSIANAKLANSTITINGTAVALGASASIAALAWQSVITSNTTMVAGRGYFVNTTSGAISMTLPAGGTAGDTIAIKDYAGTFATNKLTILRNSHKIQGVANDNQIGTNRASLVLVYIDATKGWLYTNESNVADLQNATFISATGGTVATSGDFKIHSFTGDGNFVVGQIGNGPSTPTGGPTNVDYLVVAGGGGGGGNQGGGGGAGGHRTSFPSPSCNAGAFPVTTQTYPISVGAGGTGSPNSGATSGSNSVFSTITSTGGGGAGGGSADASNGGSGGGAQGRGPKSGGTGNTPPVSPSQGNNGGAAPQPDCTGAGGGGASAVGGNGGPRSTVAPGGNGSANSITGSSVTRAGGGGAGQGGSAPQGGAGGTGGSGGGGRGGQDNTTSVAGTANTGGGGGGGANPAASGPSGFDNGRDGGKGIVIIRYKFQ